MQGFKFFYKTIFIINLRHFYYTFYNKYKKREIGSNEIPSYPIQTLNGELENINFFCKNSAEFGTLIIFF